MKLAKKCPCCSSNIFNKNPSVLMPFISKRIFDYDVVAIDQSWKLYNFPEGLCLTQCSSCQCKNCDFLFLDMRFDDEEMSNLYKGYRDEEYVALRDFYEPDYANKNTAMLNGIKYKSDIETFLENLGDYKNILDWGGDDGINTPFPDSENVYIYDISNKEVLGNFISLNENQIEDHSYDLIVCSNVLEHVSYPQEILFEISKLMDQNTILYIEVPYEKIMNNLDKDNLYKQKRHWHEHINFYSEKSLIELIKSCNLDIVKKQIYSQSINTYVSNVDQLFMIACKKV